MLSLPTVKKSYALFCSLCLIYIPIHTEKTLLGWQPDWDSNLDFNEIEGRLQTENIIERRDMHSFLRRSNKQVRTSHSIEIVVLESGLKAVLKEENACYGEIAAYKASKALGLRLVPPTILRKIGDRVVSLQFYVASKIDLLRNSSIMRKIPPKDASDRKVFEYVFNRWDTHPGNQVVSLVKGKYNLALIDNAGLFFLSRHPEFSIKNIDAATLLALKKIDNQQALEDIWSDFTPIHPEVVQKVIQRTLKRINLLITTVESDRRMIKNFLPE